MVIVIVVLFIILSLILLAIILGFTFFAVDTFLDLPYVATKREKVAIIIKLASIKPSETVIDLGSGDGRLLFAAAQKGARAIGYEVNPYLVIFTHIKTLFLNYSSRERQRVEKSENGSSRLRSNGKGTVTVIKQNLWHADLKTADVIFVYGRGKTMKRFEDFVFKNAKKGTRIVVNTDLTKPFPTKRPLKSENGIFLYNV